METKFRALTTKYFKMLSDEVKKEWVEGYFVKDYENTAYITTLNGQDTWVIEESTVSLFTGFSDAGKTELFAGDIIENDGVTYIIEWCDHMGRWNAINVYTGDDIALCELCPSNETWYQGNKIENPELLER